MQRFKRKNINGSVERLFELEFQVGKVQQTLIGRQLNQKIKIAPSVRLASNRRAKERRAGDTSLVEDG